MTLFKRYDGPDPNKVGSPPMPPLHWMRPSPKLVELAGIVAIVTCKNGHACSLRVPKIHSLSPEGVMHPSLQCPYCPDGHEPAGSVLEGWKS